MTWGKVVRAALKACVACADDAGMGMFRLLMNLVRPPMALLSAEIVADPRNRFHVAVSQSRPDATEVEHVWFPLMYFGKMVYVLARSEVESVFFLLYVMGEIADSGLERGTDCFQVADLADAAGLSATKPSEIDWRATATLRLLNPSARAVITHLPLRGTEQQAVFSAVALLQTCALALSDEMRRTLTRALCTMVETYTIGCDPADMRNLIIVPRYAFATAVMEHDEAA